jgi:hypothetical protein
MGRFFKPPVGGKFPVLAVFSACHPPQFLSAVNESFTMSLAGIQPVGTMAVAATSVGGIATNQSAKFAGRLKNKLASNAAANSAGKFQLPNGTLVDISKVRASAAGDLAQIQSQLMTLMAQHGINPGNGVTLQVDGQGHAQAVGANAAAINSLLAAQPDLASRLASVAQKERVLQAANGVTGSGSTAQQAFTTSYSALGTPSSTFTLVVGRQGSQVSFSPAQQSA